MAADLSLGLEETIQTVQTEHEKLYLRETWWSVVGLDIISSWGQSEISYCVIIVYSCRQTSSDWQSSQGKSSELYDRFAAFINWNVWASVRPSDATVHYSA